MKLKTIYDGMTRCNASAAPGSECNAWQDFVADCYQRFGFSPWADAHWDEDMPEDFAEYWTEVAQGSNSDYDAENGARIGT